MSNHERPEALTHATVPEERSKNGWAEGSGEGDTRDHQRRACAEEIEPDVIFDAMDTSESESLGKLGDSPLLRSGWELHV